MHLDEPPISSEQRWERARAAAVPRQAFRLPVSGLAPGELVDQARARAAAFQSVQAVFTQYTE